MLDLLSVDELLKRNLPIAHPNLGTGSLPAVDIVLGRAEERQTQTVELSTIHSDALRVFFEVQR